MTIIMTRSATPRSIVSGSLGEAEAEHKVPAAEEGGLDHDHDGSDVDSHDHDHDDHNHNHHHDLPDKGPAPDSVIQWRRRRRRWRG